MDIPKTPFEPKAGEWYRIDRHGKPQKYTAWRQVQESLPWIGILSGALAVIIGATVWLGWVVVLVVGVYLGAGVAWFVWDIGTAPETMDEARRGRRWRLERLRLSRSDMLGFALIVLPMWPFWATGKVVI